MIAISEEITAVGAACSSEMAIIGWSGVEGAVLDGGDDAGPLGRRDAQHRAPGRILIPDLVVVTNPGLDLTVWDPADVAMVVEIVSAGSVAADRAIKPQLYAAAGIGHYLRIELSRPSPSSVAYQLQRDRYTEGASSRPGQPLRLVEPFPVGIDLPGP